jgi:hypothetical protein
MCRLARSAGKPADLPMSGNLGIGGGFILYGWPIYFALLSLSIFCLEYLMFVSF